MLFAKSFSDKFRRKIENTWVDALKTASKKVLHKADKTRGGFISNKTGDRIVKKQPVIDEKSRNIEEILILPKKME